MEIERFCSTGARFTFGFGFGLAADFADLPVLDTSAPLGCVDVFSVAVAFCLLLDCSDLTGEEPPKSTELSYLSAILFSFLCSSCSKEAPSRFASIFSLKDIGMWMGRLFFFLINACGGVLSRNARAGGTVTTRGFDSSSNLGGIVHSLVLRGVASAKISLSASIRWSSSSSAPLPGRKCGFKGNNSGIVAGGAPFPAAVDGLQLPRRAKSTLGRRCCL
mmetsp:Transcript_67330/g.122924  ORF Transcript_67330/g.122924 Transcript_67330/m.122924 type:complete len:219 (+) Transcript_67330:981-1637(+)